VKTQTKQNVTAAGKQADETGGTLKKGLNGLLILA